jgi:hypothetical protein
VCMGDRASEKESCREGGRLRESTSLGNNNEMELDQ